MKSLGRELEIGCGDNSCRWGPRGGMATNGGCRCFDKSAAAYADNRLTYEGIAALRTLAEAPAIMAALHALATAVVVSCIPNAETRAAMRELENGGGEKSNSVEELMKELRDDD